MTDIVASKIPNLTRAEIERLAMLIEECGEVIQAATKILRHGYRSHHPHDTRNPPMINRISLEQELGDVLAIYKIMVAAKDLTPETVEGFAKLASETKLDFTHHQNSLRK